MAFLDDDAQAADGWLAALVAPYDDPDVVATGGRIRPAFDDGRPGWLPEELDWIVGCTYRGMPERRADVRNAIGAGMSVRRDVLELVGGSTRRSAAGVRCRSGAREQALCIRARRSIPGARVVYEPAAVVAHRVPRGRSSIRYD